MEVYSPREVEWARMEIYTKSGIPPNLQGLDTKDLERLFGLYDHYFFQGQIGERLVEEGISITFKIGGAAERCHVEYDEDDRTVIIECPMWDIDLVQGETKLRTLQLAMEVSVIHLLAILYQFRDRADVFMCMLRAYFHRSTIGRVEVGSSILFEAPDIGTIRARVDRVNIRTMFVTELDSVPARRWKIGRNTPYTILDGNAQEHKPRFGYQRSMPRPAGIVKVVESIPADITAGRLDYVVRDDDMVAVKSYAEGEFVASFDDPADRESIVQGRSFRKGMRGNLVVVVDPTSDREYLRATSVIRPFDPLIITYIPRQICEPMVSYGPFTFYRYPGGRSVVIIADEESLRKLLPELKKIVMVHDHKRIVPEIAETRCNKILGIEIPALNVPDVEAILSS